MSEWKFRRNEVIRHKDDGYLYHVKHRYECVDTGDRKYQLWDATHTADKTVHADDAEGWDDYDGEYESTGVVMNAKPAVRFGCRINGVLAGPKSVDYWRGNECSHDYPCRECGAPDRNVDILVAEGYVLTDCRECDNWDCVEA